MLPTPGYKTKEVLKMWPWPLLHPSLTALGMWPSRTKLGEYRPHAGCIDERVVVMSRSYQHPYKHSKLHSSYNKSICSRAAKWLGLFQTTYQHNKSSIPHIRGSAILEQAQ